ncbi:hypothetical protein ABH930_000310 [Kitasatospora sp. GAS204A]|uniref:hypothetical protein n=1 Tax=unclassified Kitasatospora TaxID=2633591 RepID=UPI002476D791|nr:hypothetical protein [Kitasatospora sp. GAS204B]MDH6116891.1 hypothetical protein [Kitasatospora sp. GAS204B]
MTDMTIVRAVQTCLACPSQWDAWTDTGQYLYLRYRWGTGTAEAFPSPDVDTWPDTDATIAEFDTGRDLDGTISLTEFCAQAGLTLELAAVPEH